MKTDRILNILYYLNRYKKVNAKELAEKFEVSLRTVYRDLDTLESMGIPIERKIGFDGGVSIIENFKLENINFSKSELTRIIEILKNYYYKDDKTKLLLEKFQNIMSDKEIEEQRKQDYFKVETNDQIGKKDYESISFIKKAIENKNIIQIEYVNNKNEISLREIEPYVISIRGKKIYMFGYCLLKSELRIFNISRIVKLEILKKKYNLKEEILEEIYSKKEFFRFYCDDSVVLRYERDTFKFASLYFDDSDYDILDNDLYKNKILDDDVIIKLKWRIDDWLMSFILNFGDKVEVLEPESLRVELMKRVSDLHNLYFKGD